jgi:hypothetical protein
VPAVRLVLYLNDSLIEQWTTLEEDVAKVRCRFTYFGGPNQGFRGCEAPAVFLAGEMDLFTYEGAAPWTNGSLTQRHPGPVNEYYAATERWWAYIYAGFGAGVYVPICQPYYDVSQNKVLNFTCYVVTNASYVAPIATFMMAPGAVHDFTYYLTVGTTANIRARFKALYEAGATAGPGASSILIENALFMRDQPLTISPQGALSIRRPDGNYVSVDVGKDQGFVRPRVVMPNGLPVGIG